MVSGPAAGLTAIVIAALAELGIVRALPRRRRDRGRSRCGSASPAPASSATSSRPR
jgi:hypothetical protein